MKKIKIILPIIILLILTALISTSIYAKYIMKLDLATFLISVEPQCYMTFDANGGTLSDTDGLLEGNKKLVAKGDTYGTLPTATGDTTFLGWYTDKASGARVIPGDTILSASDFTLYAHYATSNTCDKFNVASVDELNKALAQAKANGGGTIRLVGDIALTSTTGTITITDLTNTILDLNNYTISGSFATSGSGLVTVSGASDITIMNGTISNDASTSSTSAYYGVYVTDTANVNLSAMTVKAPTSALRDESTGTINIIDGIYTATYASSSMFGSSNYGVAIDNNSTGTINIYGSPTVTAKKYCASTSGTGSTYAGGTINIYGGTYKLSGTNISIGTTYNFSTAGGISVYAGTFSKNVSDFKVSTSDLTQSGSGRNKTYVVTSNSTLPDAPTISTPMCETTPDSGDGGGDSGTDTGEDDDILVIEVSNEEEMAAAYEKYKEIATTSTKLKIKFADNITTSSTYNFNLGGNVIIDMGDYDLTNSSTTKSQSLIGLSGSTNLTFTSVNGVLDSNGIAILNEGTGTVTLDAYRILSNTDVAIRNTSSGSIIINDSVIRSEHWAGVNNKGSGTVDVTNSTIVGGYMSIRNNSDATGSVTIHSGIFKWTGEGTDNGQTVSTSVVGEHNMTITGGSFYDTTFASYYSNYVDTSLYTYTTSTDSDGDTYYEVVPIS